MTKTNFLASLLVFLTLQLGAQNAMDSGFKMLESGQFDQAEAFFETYLQSDADNTTARICHARAMGLAGNPEEAYRSFCDLKRAHPDNLEIDLNQAESLMWMSDYKTALKKYNKILASDSRNFTAVLGKANALSNLKSYSSAYHTIMEALSIQVNDPNAMISLKYILLGWANEKSNQGQYRNSLKLVEEALLLHPDDEEILMNKLNLYWMMRDYENAESTLKGFLVKNILLDEAYRGLAHLNTIKGKKKNVLEYAKKAVAHSVKNSTSQNLISLINAYGLNQNFSEANRLIDSCQIAYPGEKRFDLAEARIDLWDGRYEQSMDKYDKILSTQKSASMDFLLGKAEVHKALNQDHKALDVLQGILQEHPFHPDALKMHKSIIDERKPTFAIEHIRSFDNGNNDSRRTAIDLSFYLFKKIKKQFLPLICLSHSQTPFIMRNKNSPLFNWIGRLVQG